ncbi:transposase, partial [Streptococcus pneumoniae]|nr:transposase [Streptococcus pneumoniae]MDS3350450.1 transposase [Streptococcus pneumoniae]MDS4424902.1 transposase [Streptococcus pneumoniae]MDS5433941.1 transposase [Streptococcus pneumoniae]MDS5593416.1 transposase [Streptococcus pneumoniae]
SLKGQLRRGKVSGRRYQRISLVAGLTNGELIAPMTYEETMTSDFFEAWFRKFLLLILNTPSIIIMDNARFHRMGKLELLCEEFGHKLLPLLVSIDYNNLIKIIKRNANFEKFKTRILIALNIKKERTKGVAFDEFNEIISRF